MKPLLLLRHNLLRASLLASLAGLLTGCAALLTPTVTLPANQPAEIFLPLPARQVAIISRYDATQLPYKKDRKVEVYRDGARAAVASVARQLGAEATFQPLRHDTLLHAAAGRMPVLPPAEVQALCRRWNVQSLLALEYFDAYMNQDDVVKEKDSSGNTSKTASYSLVVQTQWTLYDAQGQLLNQSAVDESRPYEQRQVLSGLLAAGPAMAKAGEKVQELADLAGTDYAQRYLPAQIAFVRDYYAGAELKEAVAGFTHNDWQASVAPLTALAGSPDAKLASQAAYNLSVAYEALNDLNAALRWATEAAQKSPADNHTRRVQEVRQRQQTAAAFEAQRAAYEGTKP